MALSTKLPEMPAPLQESSDQTGSHLESKRRPYSFNEVSNMTNNFERILSRGGFGTVYYGIIDDIQVAVKMLSQSSVQGYQQFLAEASDNYSLLSSF
ncbi:hypothetical protein PIB30_065737 [Stylosanthes scabra]|uniref:Uncharacterized protein n=1 Tax=Stylosanthes scabra TaxID=79078 RepID=A0ABU6SNM4_9FABA|nr:hypothetical protein [Stylosanthes scabra]